MEHLQIKVATLYFHQLLLLAAEVVEFGTALANDQVEVVAVEVVLTAVLTAIGLEYEAVTAHKDKDFQVAQELDSIDKATTLT
jgi:hypothetical protein